MQVFSVEYILKENEYDTFNVFWLTNLGYYKT